MNPERFDHLLSLFHNSIKRTKIQIYKVITAGACLAITLRFLVSGEAQQSLSYSFCKGKSTVRKIISEMCEDIYKAFQCRAISEVTFFQKTGRNSEIWRSWNFLHIVRSIESKQLWIKCTKLTGILSHNYKELMLINVLLSLILVVTGVTVTDVLANFAMGKAFESCKFHLPNNKPWSGCEFSPLPYFLLSDNGFC